MVNGELIHVTEVRNQPDKFFILPLNFFHPAADMFFIRGKNLFSLFP